MDPLINVGDVTDLVILDIELPRLGGRDVQRELAANAATRNIPIVVVTGSDTSLLDACAFYCVLRKPVTTDSLVAIVDRCLQDAQRRRNRPAASRAQAERRKALYCPFCGDYAVRRETTATTGIAIHMFACAEAVRLGQTGGRRR
jgi:DNA-binding response OmpR family regulator